MSDVISAVVSVLNLLGLGGLGVGVYVVFRALQERINALTALAAEQTKTLDAVRARAEESDRLAETYKRAVFDYEELGQKLNERRNELVKELEDASARKDSELARLKEIQIEELDLYRQSVARSPAIEERLSNTVAELQKQLQILAPVRPDPFDELYRFSWLRSNTRESDNQLELPGIPPRPAAELKFWGSDSYRTATSRLRLFLHSDLIRKTGRWVEAPKDESMDGRPPPASKNAR